MRILLITLCLISFNVAIANFSDFPKKEQLAQIQSDLPYDQEHIMADYTSIYIPSSDKTFYEVLFWDSKSGQSVLYYYDYDEEKFIPYESNVQLPDAPLKGKVGGKIMMDYTAVYITEDDKTFYEIFVWDTETGRSSLYYYNYDEETFIAYDDNVQLPESPIKSPKGIVMADYSSIHIPSEEKTYYEVLFWDTKTGKSVLYYYNYTEEQFIVYDDNVQIPAKPLRAAAKGDYMMDYTALYVPSDDQTFYEILVWDTETGQSNLYYFNYDEEAFVAYDAEIQIPESPLEVDVSGNILMDYTAIHIPSQNKTYYETFVWDTKTGKSQLYYYEYDAKKFIPYDNNLELPETISWKSDNGKGVNTYIMADYTSVYVESEDKTYYEVFYWNTATGESELYYYNYSEEKFVSYDESAQLPVPSL